jgi:hypothetical protein
MSKPTIGFVGLGAMGFGMATNLVREGYPVVGFDVFPASVQRFQSQGGIPASSLRESAEGKDFYICMVASAPQAQSVLFGDDGVVQCTLLSPICIIRNKADIEMNRPPEKCHPPSLLHSSRFLCTVRSCRAAVPRPCGYPLHRLSRVRGCQARRRWDLVHHGWCVGGGAEQRARDPAGHV